VGEFKDSKFSGQGTLTYGEAYGTKYVGEWKEDKFNGQGTLTQADGTTQSGLWKDDMYIGPAPAQTNAPAATGTDKKR
jgi:hypothetical protein